MGNSYIIRGRSFQFGQHSGPYMDRAPYPSESAYFASNRQTAGMAAEDDKVVMNPHSGLSPVEKESVRNNEMARILMRQTGIKPSFSLTDKQIENLKGTAYADATDQDRKETIAARLLSGDPSAGEPTPEQESFVRGLRDNLAVRGVPFDVDQWRSDAALKAFGYR